MTNFNRHSIRLKGFNYANSGWYFVTICTYEREYLFGNVGVVRAQPAMVLNKMGKIVESVWESLPKHHPVELDRFQIMPNHVHMIIICRGFACKTLNPNRGIITQGIARNALTTPPISGSLSCVVRSFKSEITKQIRIIVENSQFPVWQRNFYERIIRNEEELFKIREYIKSNPLIWERDRNNLKNMIKDTG